MRPDRIDVDVTWGDVYLDVYTTFKIGPIAWRLLSYIGISEGGPIVDGDPEVSHSDLEAFVHTVEVPPELEELFKELTEKAHDHIALERLKGRPQ